MMGFSSGRVIAMVRRHLLLTFRTFDKFANVIYWPFINIVIWGLTSVGAKSGVISISTAKLLIAVSLWQIVLRVTIETARGVLEELLNKNFVNLFATPLTIYEWISAIMILGCINLFLIVTACTFFTYLLFGLNIFMLGFQLIPIIVSLLITGWGVGFLMASMFVRWGMRVNDFLFVIVWGIAPFSAIYASVDILPLWAQKIAYSLPLMYVFESMRTGVSTGTINGNYLLVSFALNLLYFSAIMSIFLYAFTASRARGLGRLG